MARFAAVRTLDSVPHCVPDRAGRAPACTTARSRLPAAASRCQPHPRRPARRSGCRWSPSDDSWNEPLVGLPRRRQSVALLVGAKCVGQPGGSQPARGVPRASACRWCGPASAVAAAGLEHHRREHRGQLGGLQPSTPAAQTLGDQQVALAVDAGQQAAVGGDADPAHRIPFPESLRSRPPGSPPGRFALPTGSFPRRSAPAHRTTAAPARSAGRRSGRRSAPASWSRR